VVVEHPRLPGLPALPAIGDVAAQVVRSAAPTAAPALVLNIDGASPSTEHRRPGRFTNPGVRVSRGDQEGPHGRHPPIRIAIEPPLERVWTPCVDVGAVHARLASARRRYPPRSGAPGRPFANGLVARELIATSDDEAAPLA